MYQPEPEALEEARLAYENPEFLNSADGRILRIMAEYQEPLGRFRRERIQDTVVFFGSARFRALDVARAEMELLANTGSAEPAPEQPATPDEIARGEAECARASACGGRDPRWRPSLREMRAGWRECLRAGRSRCPDGGTGSW